MEIEVRIPVKVQVTDEMIEKTVEKMLESGDCVIPVRCRDCIYNIAGQCQLLMFASVKDDFYCANGESLDSADVDTKLQQTCNNVATDQKGASR